MICPLLVTKKAEPEDPFDLVELFPFEVVFFATLDELDELFFNLASQNPSSRTYSYLS